MRYEHLYEVEQVEIHSQVARPVAELAPIFLKLGFTVHDDVVSLDRRGRIPPWQHSSVVEIEILLCGEEVFDFAEGKWDTMRIKYLFASLPFELTEKFIENAFSIGKDLSLPIMYAGLEIDEQWLRQRLGWIRQKLLDQTGEEAGSEGLAIIIHSQYPRR